MNLPLNIPGAEPRMDRMLFWGGWRVWEKVRVGSKDKRVCLGEDPITATPMNVLPWFLVGSPTDWYYFFYLFHYPCFSPFSPSPLPPQTVSPRGRATSTTSQSLAWAHIRHSTTKRFFQGKKLKLRRARDRPGKGWH